MAMYYYASKLSAIACGTRCQHAIGRKNYPQRSKQKWKNNGGLNMSENDGEKESKAFSPTTTDKIILGTSSELPEFSCDNAPDNLNTELDTSGIIYSNGNIMSGPQDSLVDLLMPNKTEDLDKEYIFSFLLSSRLFIRPHELLGRLLSAIPDTESLDRLVALLSIWTKIFPYDFREERIMCHVKHIVARCTNTSLEDVVSELLSALLNRLTELEQHEEELRACQPLTDETETIRWPSAITLAQILCRIERKLAKHVGPEEFLQCSNNILYSRSSKKAEKLSGPSRIQNSKKTCNLESYLEWSARLRLLVSNTILLGNGIRERGKVIELWCDTVQYCLLVGNYNSTTVILESLESPAIARLKMTWSQLPSTTQQLNCMQRHANGYGDLWNKQTGHCQSDKKKCHLSKTKSSDCDWVAIPVFADIVRLALRVRDDCLTKLPNGHINIAAFNRLAAIVGAFTKHMSEVNTNLTEVDEYEQLSRHMQNCILLNEAELMRMSFECEEPTAVEKDIAKLT